MDIEASVEEFGQCRPLFERFRSTLEDLVENTLRRIPEIGVVTIEARTKTVESFRGKLERKGSKYVNPLEDITDLVGVRVVVYFRRDIDAVCDLLCEELVVDEEASVDKQKELDFDRFGYASRHIIGHLKDYRVALPENREFEGLKAEFQVRTALQHAWATIEHKIRYKGIASLSGDANRGFSRLAALLETADIEFDRLRDIGEELDGEVERVHEGDLEQSVSPLTIEAYLLSTGVGEAYADKARTRGFMVSESEDVRTELEGLQRICKDLGLSTLDQLDQSLNVSNIDEKVAAVTDKLKTLPFEPELGELGLLQAILLAESGNPVMLGNGLFDSKFLEVL